MRSPEFQFLYLACGFAGRKICELIDRMPLDTHVTRHGIQTRAVTTRAFARFAFFDPFRLALGGELGFQNRFAVGTGSGLQILVPNFAESATFLTRAVRRIKRKQTRIELLERAATIWAAHFGAHDCQPVFRVKQTPRAATDLQRPTNDLARLRNSLPINETNDHIDRMLFEPL